MRHYLILYIKFNNTFKNTKMSRNYSKHQIDRIKRAIEAEKSKIADSQADITSVRNRKKSRAESYAYKIQSTSSSASKANLRSSRADEWREFARIIDKEKEVIASCRERISRYREDIKRERQRNH